MGPNAEEILLGIIGMLKLEKRARIRADRLYFEYMLPEVKSKGGDISYSEFFTIIENLKIVTNVAHIHYVML